MFGARVVQWVVLCLCLGRKKGMERGTLGATTDTSGQLDRVFIFYSFLGKTTWKMDMKVVVKKSH